MNTRNSEMRVAAKLNSALFPGLLGALLAPLSGQIIYNNIPAPQPGNVASQAFEATQTSEFSAGVIFSAGSPRLLSNVKVLMSSWGCLTGSWVPGGNCVTPPGSTFAHPITLNIY